jgi:hopanoid biosynthesis associated RND transporter like protein HpnN
MYLSSLLSAVVGASRRHALAAFVAGLALLVLSAGFAYERLGVSTNTDLLFSASLPWRQREIAFNKLFPQFQDLLVVVIDAKQPEEADQTAAELAAMLAPDKAHFADVARPDTSPYFDRNAFMFLGTKQLEPLLDSTIDAQPFLGQLVADPSARGLFSALALLAMGVERGQADLGPFRASLEAFHTALAEAASGHPQPLSWERLLGGKLADLAGPYRFVLVHPVVNYGALAPGGAASDAIRAAARQLEFVRNGDARVRITGAVALADEEFATVAQGALKATIGSALLIVVWLILAVRSWRLIVPIVLTLFLGLSLTTGFATAAVGTLNLISVAFAILFVGIAVDFAIQFSVRYREARHEQDDPGAALTTTAHRVGPQILVAAAATAAGFLAFVPTAFTGVAQLGLIAGVGMLIAFLCTLLFLPAALTLFRPRAEGGEVGFALLDRAEAGLVRVRYPVL